MNGISEPSFMPCYHIDLSTKKATLGKYNFTKFLEQQTKLAEEGNRQTTSISKITPQKIQELAKKYNPQQMSQDEYRNFIHELEHEGVLSSDESFAMIANCTVVRPGTYGCFEMSSPSFPQSITSIRSLADANGDVIYWLSLMRQQRYSSSKSEVEAIKKISDILEKIAKIR